jgi:hypothetical protein
MKRVFKELKEVFTEAVIIGFGVVIALSVVLVCLTTLFFVVNGLVGFVVITAG